MEHVTALVDHDATTPITCSCAKLVAAGWIVRCSACGRGRTADWTADWMAQFAEFAGVLTVVQELVELEDDVDDEGWSSIEGYDVARDDRLVDEAERRVA